MAPISNELLSQGADKTDVFVGVSIMTRLLPPKGISDALSCHCGMIFVILRHTPEVLGVLTCPDLSGKVIVMCDDLQQKATDSMSEP